MGAQQEPMLPRPRFITAQQEPMLLRLLLAVAALGCCVNASSHRLDAAEQWIRNTRLRTPYRFAPGVTGLLISDGQLRVFGDGVQKHGTASPANKDTLMEIGSLSKTMVGLALGVLVSDGVVSWDDRVQRWLGPDFAFGPSAYVSKALSVKDLLAHRTGLAEGQGEFITGLMSS